MPIKQYGDYLTKLIFCVHSDGLYVCVCVQLQDVYAVESSVCLLYTEAVCRGCSPASTQSHPPVPAFLHSSLNTASRRTVNSIVWHTPDLAHINTTMPGCFCGTDKAPKCGMVLTVQCSGSKPGGRKPTRGPEINLQGHKMIKGIRKIDIYICSVNFSIFLLFDSSNWTTREEEIPLCLYCSQLMFVLRL